MALRRNRRQYLARKEEARALVRARVAHFGALYGVMPNKIFIKDLRSRWGSCSERGNLNFNYKLVLLPPPLADYVIVHELCHLREFNHSPKFWALVAHQVPNHRELRTALRSLERQRLVGRT